MPKKPQMSQGKRDRERARLEKRMKKSHGKPSGQPGTGLRRKRHQRQWLKLKRVGSAWLPDFTLEALNDLKRTGRASIGQYSFLKDNLRSTDTLLFFETEHGADLTSNYRKHLGHFLIDLETMAEMRVEPGPSLAMLDEKPLAFRQGAGQAGKRGGSQPAKWLYYGRRRAPEISQSVLNNILNFQSVKKGRFSYDVDKKKSPPGSVFFTIRAGNTKIGDYEIFRQSDRDGKRPVYDA